MSNFDILNIIIGNHKALSIRITHIYIIFILLISFSFAPSVFVQEKLQPETPVQSQEIKTTEVTLISENVESEHLIGESTHESQKPQNSQDNKRNNSKNIIDNSKKGRSTKKNMSKKRTPF